MIEIMDDNSKFINLLNDHSVEPQEIMDEFSDECPSFYTLKDDEKICSPSGDGCYDCWLNAIAKYREKRNE